MKFWLKTYSKTNIHSIHNENDRMILQTHLVSFPTPTRHTYTFLHLHSPAAYPCHFSNTSQQNKSYVYLLCSIYKLIRLMASSIYLISYQMLSECQQTDNRHLSNNDLSNQDNGSVYWPSKDWISNLGPYFKRLIWSELKEIWARLSLIQSGWVDDSSLIAWGHRILYFLLAQVNRFALKQVSHYVIFDM